MKELKDGLKVTSTITLILTIIGICVWGLVELIWAYEILSYVVGAIILFLAFSWAVGHNLNRVNSNPSKKEIPFYEKIENYPKALD